jgi:hypothetical protein
VRGAPVVAVLANMQKSGFGVAALSAVLFGFVPASAATITRDALERKLLDSCIYRQYQVQDIDRQSMVENCRCAADTALASIGGDSFDVPRSGGLTGPQDQAIRAGIAACFTN